MFCKLKEMWFISDTCSSLHYYVQLIHWVFTSSLFNDGTQRKIKITFCGFTSEACANRIHKEEKERI